tara:strand:+ start:3781 stop:4047 length:267 start_codon:yes stop_codon:yes gene_type:complete
MTNKMTINIGEFVTIENKSRKAGANSRYVFGYASTEGREVPLMLTECEYAKAIERANKNPEDCIQRYKIIRPQPKKRGFMAWLRKTKT